MTGYWEPHTSSIDFCESNYLHTHYVAEIHNMWSSIVGISLFGVLGLMCGNPSKELRFSIAYFILVLIGVGSACLHATLHWVYQSSDELPMVYLITTYIYIFLELESPPKPKRINNRGHDEDDDDDGSGSGGVHKKLSTSSRYPNLSLHLSLLMVVNTIIYYKFQNLYWVFLLTFGLGLTSYVTMVGRMFYKGSTMTKNHISKKVIALSVVSYFFVGSPSWIIDMLHCDSSSLSSSSHYDHGLTWHIIWHFAAGFGAYCTIVYLESFRMQSLAKDFSARYILGFIPIIVPSTAGEIKID